VHGVESDGRSTTRWAWDRLSTKYKNKMEEIKMKKIESMKVRLDDLNYELGRLERKMKAAYKESLEANDDYELYDERVNQCERDYEDVKDMIIKLEMKIKKAA